MAKLVSKVYGEALFDLARERDQISEVWEEVKALTTIFNENEEFQAVMAHPSMTGEEKYQMVQNIFQGKVTDTMMGFLDVLVKKGRFSDILSVLAYYDEQAKEHFQIGVAYVTTALEIDEAMKKKIENRLLDITEYQSFEMHFDVDKSLIGGMVIRIGDRVVDDSIKHKMETMSASLSKLRIGL